MRILKSETLDKDYIGAKVGDGSMLIPIDNVTLFRAEHKYVTIFGGTREVLLTLSLASLSEFYGDRFIFVNRNALVSRARLIDVRRDKDGGLRLIVRGHPDPVRVSRRNAVSVRAAVKQAQELFAEEAQVA